MARRTLANGLKSKGMQTRLGEIWAVRGRDLSEGRGAREEMRRSGGTQSATAPVLSIPNRGRRIFSCQRIPLERRLGTWGLTQPVGQKPSSAALDDHMRGQAY